MTLTIRAITLADAEGYWAALDSVARERRYLRLLEAPPIEGSRRFIAANIERGNPHFVAVDGDSVVGWCDLCRSDETGSEHCGWLGMGIIARYRGLGIGANLLQAALNAARPAFHRVELDVYASNTAAIALYEKAGFVHEGRRRDALLRDGAYEDILTMGLITTP